MPRVYLSDTITSATGSTEPDTVVIMVQKLKRLSHTLTDFGIMPPAPARPTLESQPGKFLEMVRRRADSIVKLDSGSDPLPKPVVPPVVEQKDAAGDLLALFDDDDRNVEIQLVVPDGHNNTGFHCESRNTAERDGRLAHVIRFIQNALRSWARHRLTSQFAGEYKHPQEQAHVEPRQQMCGLSWPRDCNDIDPCFQTDPATIHFDLAKTPEGAAIMAFEDVLYSGCLRINTSLPTELSRALQVLYAQIEHLTQAHRSEQQWRCMSYGAQITAHQIRVEKWKEQQARAQQEMTRQQRLSVTEAM